MGLFEFVKTLVATLVSASGLTEFSLYATILLLAVGAAYLSRRGGMFFLGLDGVLVSAACGAYLASLYTTAHTGDASGFDSMAAGVLGGLVAGLICTAVQAWFVVKVGSNDVLMGLTINLLVRQLGVVAIRLAHQHYQAGRTLLPVLHLGNLAQLPVIGPMFGDANLMTWLSLASPFVVYFLANRTRVGLCMRAAQENPLALEGAGVHLSVIRTQAMLWAGVFASLAGIACAMGAMPVRVQTMVPQGFGYLALLLVFAAGGRLGKSCIFALLFSALGALPQAMSHMPLAASLLRCAVYLAAFLLLILHIYRHHHRVHKRVKAQKRTRAQRKQEEAVPRKKAGASRRKKTNDDM
ncbi:MAG: hypothetical protein MSH10_09110 [Pygmaiobacter massiliensis]|nr:hypothetical protein [Pygmaiobacter massiliensis]